MKPTRRNPWVALLLAASVIGLSSLFLATRESQKIPPVEPSPTFATESATIAGPAAPAAEHYVDHAAEGETLLRSYRCTQIPECFSREISLSASSVEEARWMAANGFPTAEERAWAANRSSAEILHRAKEERSASLEALGLEAKLREPRERGDALGIYVRQIDLAFATGRRYFFYGAFESALAAERESAGRLRELSGLPALPDSGGAGQIQVGSRASEVLLMAMILGDHRIVGLMPQGIGTGSAAERRLLQEALSDSRNTQNAWRTLREISANPAAPLSIRTVQPRPTDPLRSSLAGP